VVTFGIFIMNIMSSPTTLMFIGAAAAAWGYLLHWRKVRAKPAKLWFEINR
jgi:hypothetical protein